MEVNLIEKGILPGYEHLGDGLVDYIRNRLVTHGDDTCCTLTIDDPYKIELKGTLIVKEIPANCSWLHSVFDDRSESDNLSTFSISFCALLDEKSYKNLTTLIINDLEVIGRRYLEIEENISDPFLKLAGVFFCRQSLKAILEVNNYVFLVQTAIDYIDSNMDFLSDFDIFSLEEDRKLLEKSIRKWLSSNSTRLVFKIGAYTLLRLKDANSE